jgi:hypothetical protein
LATHGNKIGTIFQITRHNIPQKQFIRTFEPQSNLKKGLRFEQVKIEAKTDAVKQEIAGEIRHYPNNANLATFRRHNLRIMSPLL